MTGVPPPETVKDLTLVNPIRAVIVKQEWVWVNDY